MAIKNNKTLFITQEEYETLRAGGTITVGGVSYTGFNNDQVYYVCYYTNIIGPTGIQGNIGYRGPKGELGNVGPTGPQGALGPRGDLGATGPKGPVGPTGPQGPRGQTGVQGPVGPTGPKGLTGNTGPVGPTGPIGNRGPQGPVGPTGPQGAIGPTGKVGPTGPQGKQGETGVRGPTGSVWFSGTAINTDGAHVTSTVAIGAKLGDFYLNNATGEVYRWSQKDGQDVWGKIAQLRGAQGTRGATGATGPKGDQGPMGPTGPGGAPGPVQNVSRVEEYYHGPTNSTLGRVIYKLDYDASTKTVIYHTQEFNKILDLYWEKI